MVYDCDRDWPDQSPSPVHSAGGCPPMVEQAAAYSGELNSPADLFCNSFTRKAGKTLQGFFLYPSAPFPHCYLEVLT